MYRKRVIAYVDGSNLHNQLKNVGLLEKDIDWVSFFRHALPEEYDLVRASWYHVSRLGPHQWYPSLTRRFCPPDRDEHEFERQARQWYESESMRLQKLHDEVHSRISIENDIVDFRYSGILRVNPYTQERIEEKGVGVGLTVDMVSQIESYDVAVIVSGGYDLVEAIRHVKSRGRQVHIVTIEPGMPGELRGQAWALGVLADRVTPMFESEMKSPQYPILRDSSRAAARDSSRGPAPDGPSRGQAPYRDRDSRDREPEVTVPLGYRDGPNGGRG